MRRPAKKWRLRATLPLIMLFGAVPVQAQPKGPAFLKVCNEGTASVKVVVAVEDSFYVGSMRVRGWSHITPGACRIVYDETGDTYSGAPVAYIGFAFDSNGRFAPARIDRIPDFGKRLAGGQWNPVGDPVLSKGNKTLCVHQAEMSYSTKTSSNLDCATFHPNGDSGQYFALAAALRFQPDPVQYRSRINGGDEYGGKYYLNVAPKANDQDLHASAGRGDGAPTTSASLCGAVPCLDQLAEGLKKYDPEKAAAEARKREEAEYARSYQASVARDQAATRFLANYAPDWMGKGLIVKGTVSRVDVQPMWVILYFQERPDGDFVVCFPRKLFEGFGGPNFSGLIGKAVDVRGGVTRPVCSPRTAGMQIGVPSQIKIY